MRTRIPFSARHSFKANFGAATTHQVEYKNLKGDKSGMCTISTVAILAQGTPSWLADMQSFFDFGKLRSSEPKSYHRITGKLYLHFRPHCAYLRTPALSLTTRRRERDDDDEKKKS